jgi:hypothetical protein
LENTQTCPNLEFLDEIENDVVDLVEVQQMVKEKYEELDKYNYLDNSEIIKNGLRKEKELLKKLKNDLDNLFNIKPKWYRKGFIIRKRSNDYRIYSPVIIDRSSIEYDLLKKLMRELHVEYFLHGGLIGYMYTTVESHMWEIPNEIPNNSFINKLRSEIDG